MKDGWHHIKGYRVYVEFGYIWRGTKETANGRVAAWVYRYNPRYGGWYYVEHITPSAFAAGVRRGTVKLA